MHIRARIHRWVFWWFYVGIACGIVAVTNILERDLERSQIIFILLVGVLFWGLGGLVCYVCEGISIEAPHGPPVHRTEPIARPQMEWHAASDFLLPGNRKSLLHSLYRRGHIPFVR